MNQLEPLDLDAIEARANAATKGPWGFYDGDNYADVAADLTMTGRASYSYREKIAQLEDENYWDDPAHEDDDDERAPEQMAANAAFIAAARTDVPLLLAEVRRLRDRTLTESEYNAAWHAVEGAAGEEGADPGTVLHAVLAKLGIAWGAAEETHVVADDSDDPEHIDDCPGCLAFTLTGHRTAAASTPGRQPTP